MQTFKKEWKRAFLSQFLIHSISKKKKEYLSQISINFFLLFPLWCCFKPLERKDIAQQHTAKPFSLRHGKNHFLTILESFAHVHFFFLCNMLDMMKKALKKFSFFIFMRSNIMKKVFPFKLLNFFRNSIIRMKKPRIRQHSCDLKFRRILWNCIIARFVVIAT